MIGRVYLGYWGVISCLYSCFADLVVCMSISTSCYVSDGARKVDSGACWLLIMLNSLTCELSSSSGKTLVFNSAQIVRDTSHLHKLLTLLTRSFNYEKRSAMNGSVMVCVFARIETSVYS